MTISTLISTYHLQVHIEDHEYYDELYNSNAKWEKYEPYMAQFNSREAMFSTAQYDLHRMRRKPENNFFSKRSIVALEPVIHQSLDKMRKRLDAAEKSRSLVPINALMLCFTTDVVSEYIFGESWSLLDTPDFSPWMGKAIKTAGESAHALKQWPWLSGVMNALPSSLMSRIAPEVARTLRYQDVSNYNTIH